MQVPLNSSPFPPLRPNVRYRTAMERAGFDVAFSKTSGSSTSKSGSRNTSRVASGVSQTKHPEFIPGTGLHSNSNSNSNSTSNVNSSTNLSTRSKVFATKLNKASHSTSSVNQTFYKLNGHNDSGTVMSNESGSDRGCGSHSHFDFDVLKPGVSASSPNLTTGGSGFPFTSGPAVGSYTAQSNSSSTYNTPQMGDSGEQFPPGIDPVEQSFMQLTENSSVKRDSQDDGDNLRDSYHSSVDDADVSNHISVNFAPNSALSKALLHDEPEPALIPNILVSETSDVHDLPPVPVVSIQAPEEPMDSEVPEEVDEEEINPLYPNNDLKQIEQIPSVVVEPEIVSKSAEPELNSPDGKLTAMEKLIAELDTVTLTRNKGLTPDQELSLELGTKQTHLKKSSAYLSHYEPQMINIPEMQRPDEEGTLMSLQSNSTPTFYNFHKESHEPIQTPPEKIRDSLPRQQELHEQTPMEVYPPGHGPCRNCHKEVVGKGIYSKHENELSGQWHRGCFKCITCSKPFSKRVPCYILDDQPYCQLHFHEKNNSICKVCNGFIEGECLENDKNERFHPSCLKCYICAKVIGQDYYVFNHEHTICNRHDINTLKETGVSSLPADQRRSNTISRRRTRLINFS